MLKTLKAYICLLYTSVAKLMQLADGCIELYSGNDDQVVPILSLGGNGVISVLSNVAPRQTHDMVMKYLEGDTAGTVSYTHLDVYKRQDLFCWIMCGSIIRL